MGLMQEHFHFLILNFFYICFGMVSLLRRQIWQTLLNWEKCVNELHEHAFLPRYGRVHP